jgi:hypothetical protein
LGVGEFVDDLINRYDAVSASVTILVIAIVVIIIVLGLEFWRNFFGMLGSPALIFQRLIGEVSLPPAIFVVICSGLLMAITLLLAWRDPVTGDAVKAQFNIFFDWLSEKVADAGGLLPEQISFRSWFSLIERDRAYLLAFFVLIPIGALIVWFLGGVGFHLASLMSGAKGGGGIGGMLTASAYTYIPFIMVNLFAVKYIYSGAFNTVLLCIFGLYELFLWTILMREYGRYNYVKGFVSFILGLVFTAVLTAIAILIILWIVAIIMQYT